VTEIGGVRIQEYRLFLDLLRQMLSEPDYLIPLVWAQRQFREDNYQMSSNSQLESMFHDTFSTFLQWRNSQVRFLKNKGPEKWDYKVDDLYLSHKESKGLSLCLTFNWDSGTLISGEYVPDFNVGRFEHPIILVYTPKTAQSELLIPKIGSTSLGNNTQVIKVRQMTAQSLNMKSQSKPDTQVLAGHVDAQRTKFTCSAIWSRAHWFKDFTLPALMQQFGDDILSSELFLATPSANTVRAIGGFNNLNLPGEFDLSDVEPPSGIYLLPEEWLTDLPVEANNRAHFVTSDKTRELIERAIAAGLRIPLPMWPSHYLVEERTDLFQEMQRKYHNLIRARSPVTR
jgi:hypothetical protein